MLRFFYVILINLWQEIFLVPRMEYMCRHPEKYSEERRYRMALYIVNTVIRSGRIDVVCTGQEQLPTEGGYLLVANHQGKFDPLALFATHPTQMSVVMDESRSHQPITSQFLRLVNGIPLKKDSLKESLKSLKLLGERLRQGDRCLIFPEGGYEQNHNDLQEFMPGAFKAATYVNAPIVPVALIDTYKPFGCNSLRRVTTQIHYLTPILYEEYQGLRTPQIALLVKERIAEAMEAHLTVAQ